MAAQPALDRAPRDIFEYHDGRATVHVDPLEVYYRLSSSLRGRQASLLKQRKSRHVEEAEEATELLLAAVRPAFRLQPECTDADAMALLDGYLAWLAAMELRHRECADMVAVYGVGVLDLTCHLYAGLWLNLDRIRTQRAAAVAEGLGVALSSGRVGKAFFDAISATPQDGAELEFAVNKERSERRFMANKGLG